MCDSLGCHEISIMAETKTECFGLTKCPPQAANPTHHSFHPHGSSSVHNASLSTHCHNPSLVLSTSKAIPLSCKEQPPPPYPQILNSMTTTVPPSPEEDLFVALPLLQSRHHWCVPPLLSFSILIPFPNQCKVEGDFSHLKTIIPL